MSIVRSVAKNTGIILTGNFIFRFISLVVTIYLAKYLGVADFGKFNFVFAYLSFFTLTTEFGLPSILIREITQNKDKAAELIGNALSITLLLSSLSFILSVTIIWLISYPADTTFYIYINSISIFFISFAGVYSSIFRAYLRMGYNQVAKVVSRAFTAALILFVIFIGGGLTYIIIIMVAGELINAFLNYSYSKRFINPKLKLDINLWKQLFKESFPIALSTMFFVIYTNVDVIMLSLISGDISVGYYSAASKIIVPLGLLASALEMSLFPVISSAAVESKERLSDVYNTSSKYILVLTLPIVVCVSFFSKNIISLIYGPDFMPASIALIILIWVQLFTLINTISVDALISLHEQKKVTKVSFAGAILNIILNYLLIPKYDFYGSSFATVLTAMIMMLLFFPTIVKYIDISLVKKSTIKILLANIFLALYLFFLIPMFNPYFIAFTSMFIYFTFYYLIGGIDDKDKRIFSKLLHF